MDWEKLGLNRRPARVGVIPPPVARRWSQRISLVIFIGLTFVLILLSKAETLLVDRAQNAVNDVLTPVFSVLSVPAQVARDEIVDLREIFSTHERNRRLAEDNRRLREWQELAHHLQAENARLRAELGTVEEMPRRFVTARVVADGSGAFARSLLINAGARNAIDEDLPVVAAGGLVGRIASVGTRSARVLLLTDLNSRVPVAAGADGERAILAGNNGDRLSLEYLPEGNGVTVGDYVVTSGHGGVFPPGLAVGTVVAITNRGVTVEPIVDFSRLTHVRILQVSPILGPEDDSISHDGLPLSVQGLDHEPRADTAP